MPMKNHENVCVFYKKLPTYHPQGIMEIKPKVVKKNPSMRVLGKQNETLNRPHLVRHKNYPKSVLDFPREYKTFHPTQKPVELFEYIIRTYTTDGEIVLDNCMGGFTTAVACDNANRNWIGFELQDEYCEKGLSRINENRKELGLPDVIINFPNESNK